MWEHQFSEHQIKGRIEVFATGLHGQGPHKRNVFSQTPVGTNPWDMPLWPYGIPLWRSLRRDLRHIPCGEGEFCNGGGQRQHSEARARRRFSKVQSGKVGLAPGRFALSTGVLK